MARTKLNTTQWGIIFLITCVFVLEFLMLVQSLFGQNIPTGVIGTFFDILY